MLTDLVAGSYERFLFGLGIENFDDDKVRRSLIQRHTTPIFLVKHCHPTCTQTSTSTSLQRTFSYPAHQVLHSIMGVLHGNISSPAKQLSTDSCCRPHMHVLCTCFCPHFMFSCFLSCFPFQAYPRMDTLHTYTLSVPGCHQVCCPAWSLSGFWW